MPKIKLIKIHGAKCDYCNYLGPIDEMSPWEEVTEEELNWLQHWVGRDEIAKNNVAMVILEEITSKETIDGFISNIKKFVKDQEIKQKERAEKYAEAQKKKKLLAAQKKIERAKKILQENGMQVD